MPCLHKTHLPEVTFLVFYGHIFYCENIYTSRKRLLYKHGITQLNNENTQFAYLFVCLFVTKLYSYAPMMHVHFWDLRALSGDTKMRREHFVHGIEACSRQR